MKMIEIKSGGKTTYKYVDDNYTPSEPELEQKDLTTSPRKSLGFTDISKEKWEKIFSQQNMTLPPR